MAARIFSLTAARVAAFHSASSPRGPVIVGVDDTIERRWSNRIGACGIHWERRVVAIIEFERED